MFKRQRFELPKIPSSFEEFVELLIHSSYSATHRLTIKNDNETSVVFATELMLSKVKELDVIHFDAPFTVVPRLFYQLLTIFFRVEGYTIPAIHILMTSKSEQLYKTVLKTFNGFLPDFNPLTAMCDFEKASRNAFTTVSPSSILWDVGLIYESYVQQSTKLALVNCTK